MTVNLPCGPPRIPNLLCSRAETAHPCANRVLHLAQADFAKSLDIAPANLRLWPCVQRVERPDLGVQGNANHRVAVPAADDQLLCARGRLRYPHALPCTHPSSRRESLLWECAPLQSGRVDVSRSHWHADPFAPLLNSPVRFYLEVDERAAGVHPSFP